RCPFLHRCPRFVGWVEGRLRPAETHHEAAKSTMGSLAPNPFLHTPHRCPFSHRCPVLHDTRDTETIIEDDGPNGAETTIGSPRGCQSDHGNLPLHLFYNLSSRGPKSYLAGLSSFQGSLTIGMVAMSTLASLPPTLSIRRM